MAENFELEMLIRVKSEVDKLVKFKKESENLSKEVVSANTNVRRSFDGVQRGIREAIEPLTMLRRTIFQVGSAWSLTAGVAIAAINDIQKKQSELNDMSVKTGLSAEEISKQLYGFNIATDKSKAGILALQEAQSGLNRLWTSGTKGVSELAGELRIASEREKVITEKVAKAGENRRPWWIEMFVPTSAKIVEARSGIEEGVPKEVLRKAQIEAESEALDRVTQKRQEDNSKLKEAIILRADMQSKILQMQGKELEAFRVSMQAQRDVYVDMYGDKGNIVKLFDEFYSTQEEKLRLSNLGLRQQWEIQREYFRDNINIMRSTFTSFVQDAFGGKLRTAREYFNAFLQDLVNAWIKTQIEMAMTQFIGGGASKGSTALNILGTAASIFGMSKGLSGPSTATVAPMSAAGGSTQVLVAPRGVAKYAEGGWAGRNGPELAMIGENEPEMVTPLSKMGMGGQQTKNVYYFIQAIDPRSFSEIVASNPDAIVAVTERAIESNKKIRRTIRNLT